MTAAESADITRELARGKFTDEMLNDMRALASNCAPMPA
jgi:hypothetical protein